MDAFRDVTQHDAAIDWRDETTDALLQQQIWSQEEGALMPWVVDPLVPLPLPEEMPPFSGNPRLLHDDFVAPPPPLLHPAPKAHNARKRRNRARFQLSELTGEDHVPASVAEALDKLPTESINLDWEYSALCKHHEAFLELRYKEWRSALAVYKIMETKNANPSVLARLLRAARRSESRYLLHEALYINAVCNAAGLMGGKAEALIPWSSTPLHWSDLQATPEATPARAAKVRRVLMRERKELSLLGERGLPSSLGSWDCC